MLARAIDCRAAVIDSGERYVRESPRQFARDLAWTATEIDRRLDPLQPRRGQVREPPHRDVSRIRKRERVIFLAAEERVVEFPVGPGVPAAHRPPHAAGERSKRSKHGTVYSSSP